MTWHDLQQYLQGLSRSFRGAKMGHRGRMPEPGNAMTPDAKMPQFAAPYAPDDGDIAARLLATARLAPDRDARIDRTATRLIEAIRSRDDRLGGVEDMLREFALSTKEGLAL